MRHWALLLAGLAFWFAHFFALYLIGEFAGDGTGPRAAILLLTLLSLAAIAALVIRLAGSPGSPGFERWHRSTALLGLIIAALAIALQTLPVFISA